MRTPRQRVDGTSLENLANSQPATRTKLRITTSEAPSPWEESLALQMLSSLVKGDSYEARS